MSESSSSVHRLRPGAAAYGIELDDRSCTLFIRYTSIVREGNKHTNLVSNRDLDRFTTYHILDSLKIASCLDIPTHGMLVDFGSGAGLPGIPLSIAFPDLHVILVDSRKKRCIFLESAIRELGLMNVNVLCSRLELLDSSYDDSFDLVTTRGTVPLEKFYSMAGRFVVSGGSLVSIKGDNINDERSALDSISSRKFFNILYTQPVHVAGVRDGNVVIMTKV